MEAADSSETSPAGVEVAVEDAAGAVVADGAAVAVGVVVLVASGVSEGGASVTVGGTAGGWLHAPVNRMLRTSPRQA